MTKRGLTKNISEIFDLAQSFLLAKVDLWRLLLLEKLSKAGSYFLGSLILITIFAFCLMFLSFAFAFWYADKHGSLATSFILVAGFYLLLGILIFIFRKTIIARPIIKNLSEIIFEEDEKPLEKKLQ